VPDHFHCLVQLGEGDTLPGIVGRFKSASARQANRVLMRQGPFWTDGFHDHALRRNEDLLDVARYIVSNPLRAGLVERVGDYPFWDAVWL
jgi:REP element-mobilizing transposase RayT